MNICEISTQDFVSISTIFTIISGNIITNITDIETT